MSWERLNGARDIWQFEVREQCFCAADVRHPARTHRYIRLQSCRFQVPAALAEVLDLCDQVFLRCDWEVISGNDPLQLPNGVGATLVGELRVLPAKGRG